MGAYLSQPVMKKVSSDGRSEHLAYGDSTMQGWRVSQEDAHNSLPDLVPGCSLFAVYDGHGGHEVATYTALNLPDHIGKNALYAAGQVREGLRQAFLDFDQTLTRADVIEELKVIAGRDAESDEEEEEAEREVDELFQEAHMPLEELMAKYQGGNKPANADAVRLKKKDKPLSPFLKAKAGGSGAGSSTKSSTDAGEGSCSDVEPIQKSMTEELEDAKTEAGSLGSSEETDAKSETKAESHSKSEAEEEAESSNKSEDNTESNANSKTEAEPCTESDKGTEAEPCAKSEKEPESSTKSKPEAEIIAKSESKSESDVKSETDVKSDTKSEAEADSGGKLEETDAKAPTKSATSVETPEVKSAVDTKTDTVDETKLEADGKSDVKRDADAKSKANLDADIPAAAKTNGAGGGDSVDSPSAKKTPAGAAGNCGGGGDAGDGDGDEVVSPSCNGTGNGTTKSSPARRGKGARPGSGKAPAARPEAAGPARATRKMPERAAAEVYRGVLAGARLAKQAGHGDDGDDAEAEEEEEADEDFSMEQSDNIEDDDDEADGSEEDEEEEVEEEDEEDSEQDDEDEDGCDEEDGDFMLNMKDEPGSDSGCTAVVALLHGRQLYVANVGDSRCVLSRSGRAVDMSSDHKPEDAPELQRILKAGGKVTMDGRVNGGLNLSRAFGDHAYKADRSLPADQQMISASPDVRCVTVEPDTDEFMVLACDGIWNSKKSQEVVDFVSERIRERGETQLSKICEELFDECLATNTMGDGTGCDNMTCIIVRFLPSLATIEAPAPTPTSTPASAAAAATQRAADEADTAAATAAATAADATDADATDADATAAATQRPADEAEDQPPEKRQRTE